jgi:hypothetical protein
LFARLASELQRSLTFLGRFTRCSIAQVALCGEAPELRSLTAPLGDRLGIDVEILDSLDGIASDALPEPADAFRAQSRNTAGVGGRWTMAAHQLSRSTCSCGGARVVRLRSCGVAPRC